MEPILIHLRDICTQNCTPIVSQQGVQWFVHICLFNVQCVIRVPAASTLEFKFKLSETPQIRYAVLTLAMKNGPCDYCSLVPIVRFTYCKQQMVATMTLVCTLILICIVSQLLLMI